MKKLLGTLIVLVVIVLAGYYGTGIVTERTLKKSIRVFEQNNGTTAVLTDYKRRWFKSTAKMELSVTIPEHIVKQDDGTEKIVPNERFDFEVPLTIYHGPIIFADHRVIFGLGYAATQLQLPQNIQNNFSETFAQNSVRPVLDLNVVVNYVNKAVFQLSLPAFKLLLKSNGAQFDWLGLTGNISVSSKLNPISGSFDLSGARFVQDKITATLGQVNTVYEINRTADGLYTGSADLNIPSLLVSNDQVKEFELISFDAHSDSNIQDDLFNSNFKTSFDKVFFNGKTYGPGLLEIGVENLDAKALAEINQQSQKIKQATGDEKQQAILALLPQLPKLVSHEAKFEISRLSLTMPEGDIEGDLVVSIAKTNPDSGAWLEKIQGHGKIEVPTAIVKNIIVEALRHQDKPEASLQAAMVAQLNSEKQKGAEVKAAIQPAVSAPENLDALAQKKIDDMIASKLLKQDNQRYLVEFSFADGKLTINGQPFDSSMLKF